MGIVVAVSPFIVGISVKPTSALKKLAANLRRAPQAIRRDVAARLRTEVKRLVDQGFITKLDPYGSRWKPPQDGGTTMQRTGRLRKGFVVAAKPDGSGIQLLIQNKQEYAQWLQAGTAKMEPRRMVPDDGPLPQGWRDMIQRAYIAASQAWLMRSRNSGGGGL